MARYIPYIFHQTWKNKKLPAELNAFRQTWLQNHPSAEHRFWTDKDNLAFLEKYYAWFVPAYKRYPENIMRVDAARYFIIYHYGGIYVDMDFECLRPIDPLLEDKHFVIGCEPSTHRAIFGNQSKPDEIICNAFIAAAPQHPFMQYLIGMLSKQASRQTISQDPNAVLDLTGPLFVTQVYQSYPDKDQIDIKPARLLYPINKEEVKKPREEWDLREAYAIHHWKGTWWRGKNITRLLKRILWKIKNG